MKGGVAVLLDLATTIPNPALDVTYVFYACEEVAAPPQRPGPPGRHPPRSSRRRRGRARRAHRRRRGGGLPGHHAGGGVAWAGAGRTPHGRGQASTPCTGWRRCSTRSSATCPRRVVLDGCEYTEQLQAVGIEGGVADNVVPDRATGHNSLPLRPARSRWPRPRRRCATSWVPALDPSAGDGIDIVDAASGAPPGLGHPAAGGARRRHGRAGAGQAGVDRRGHLRRARGAGHQLRPRRPVAGPHARRARVAP